MSVERPRRRKLLVASVGIASVSYVVGVACLDNGATSGNLPGPPPPSDATTDRVDTGIPPTSGNLPAPPPPDAASDADAGDASDAADAGEDADAGS